MKSKINKSVKPYLSLYEEAKSKGIEDIEKAFWYEYLAYCNYSERTNHIFCGYLEGIGTHDRAWMLEKDKELIKSGHADCIRFIPIISFSELDELITVCMQNNVNLREKRHLIGVFGAFLSKDIEKDCIFELSIDAQIFFLNLLVKAVSQNNINDIIVPEDLKIYEYFLSNLKINSATEASVATACIELVECFRKSDCSEQKELVKSIRDFIYVRFPDNKKKYESKKDQIIERFFKPLVSDYLCAYSTQLENFTVSFPCLWKNFIEPLQALSFSKTPLYRFFCEPIFF